MTKNKIKQQQKTIYCKNTGISHESKKLNKQAF